MKPRRKIDKPLGQILVERGAITSEQLQQALETQANEGGLIGEVIVRLGFAKKEEIAYCLSLQLGYPLTAYEKSEGSYKRAEKPLGQILVERGTITYPQLEQILKIREERGGLIGELIVELGFANEEDIAYCLSLQYGYPYLPLKSYEVSKEITKIVPKNICAYYCLLPVDKIGNALTVAMADPLNFQAIDDLKDISDCDIQIFVSTPSDIRNAIERFY